MSIRKGTEYVLQISLASLTSVQPLQPTLCHGQFTKSDRLLEMKIRLRISQTSPNAGMLLEVRESENKNFLCLVRL